MVVVVVVWESKIYCCRMWIFSTADARTTKLIGSNVIGTSMPQHLEAQMVDYVVVQQDKVPSTEYQVPTYLPTYQLDIGHLFH